MARPEAAGPPAGAAAHREGLRVLVLAPSGRDAATAVRLLRGLGIDAETAESCARLASVFDASVGALVLAGEVLQGRDADALVRALRRQPPWSDVPIVLLGRQAATPEVTRAEQRAAPAADLLEGLNTLVIERPLSQASFVSAVQSALRARARQFQLRDRFEELAWQARDLLASREALAASEAQFRAIANSVDQMIWATRPDGFHDYYNDRWYEYTGVPPGSTDGEEWNGMFHPDDRDRAWARWRHSLETGDIYRIEYRLRHHSGAYRWVLGRAQPMRDGGGRVVRWFGSCTDIEELVAAREVLARSREQLEREVARRTHERDRIWQASGDLLGVADRQGNWLLINPAWQADLGWAPELVVGRSLDGFVHPDDRAAKRAAFARLQHGEQTAHFVIRLRHQDGSYRSLAWTVVPRDDRLYAVGRDVSAEQAQAAALKAAEEQLRQAQKMEAVGQLTGGIAHDFNNMLQGIIGSLGVIKKRLELGRTDELDRFIDNANRSAFRAANLTHRLLAFSRRQPLAPTRVDVNALLHGMRDLLVQTLGEQVRLQLLLDADLAAAECDANQLESAVLNLAINARDAMPQGGGLRIRTLAVSGGDWKEAPVRDGAYVAVQVSDDGTGMPPEVVALAFDPFFTTKPVGQGTGLGLSMIYGFARQSGGFTHIDSAPGRGTTITVALPPARDAAAADDGAAGGRTDRAVAPNRVARVIVVEDEELVRQLVVDALRELGMTVLHANDGPSAIELLRRELPADLLVTDVGLPGLNGRQVAETARGLQPDLKVLFMTGYAPEAVQLSEFLQSGITLLPKPFDVHAMVDTVCEILDAALPRQR